jgi:ABC-type sulfate transport system substrate-binding protein
VIKRRQVLISSAALLTSWALPTFAQAPASVEVTLVSYAVAKPVFARLIPEFQKEWKAKTGQTVTFKGLTAHPVHKPVPLSMDWKRTFWRRIFSPTLRHWLRKSW